MKLKTCILVFLMGLSLHFHAQNAEVVAHRGYWKDVNTGQNTIASLLKADSVGCHASEFDVWISNDNVVLLHHDPTINGINIETSSAQTIMQQLTKEGKFVPTLEAFLDAAKPLNIHLVCELKAHKDKKREDAAIKHILRLVKKKGLTHRVSYISFSLHAIRRFIKKAPKGTKVYYLNGEKTPQELKKMGAAGMDYHISVLRKNPQWIEECHRLGLQVIAWTINQPKDMQWCIDNKVDMITTDKPLKLQKKIKESVYLNSKDKKD